MYLSEIKLWNFRQFGNGNNDLARDPDLAVKFTKGLNLLVGENDSGKTTIVDAINYIVVPQSYETLRIRNDDFYTKDGAKSNNLKIQCHFTGFDLAQASEFFNYLQLDDSRVIKPIEGEELTSERKAEIIKENISNLELVLFLEADGGVLDKPLWSRVKVKIGDDSVLFTSDVRYEHLRSIYLKPLRDAENELRAKPYSRLSQILIKHENFQENSKMGEMHPLTKIFNKANKDIRNFFGGEFDDPDTLEEVFTELAAVVVGKTEGNSLGAPELAIVEALLDRYKKIKQTDNLSGKEVSDTIGSHLKKFFSKKKKSNAQFEISNAELSQVLQKLNLELQDVKSGLGALNILFMSAELLLLAKEKGVSLQMGVIEEVEAHLHAQAQMRALSYLQLLSDENDSIQLFVTTHSPLIASKVNLENLIVFKDSKAYPMAREFTKLAAGDYKFLERFLDATKANLFFAEGIIIVEGDAENILIPVIAKLIGRDLTDYGVSIVNVGHIGLSRYSNIFLRADGKPAFQMAVACIKDLDIKYRSFKDASGLIVVPGDIETKRSERETILKEKDEGTVKSFISPYRTLEFDVALDAALRDDFLLSVTKANKLSGVTGNIFLDDEKESALLEECKKEAAQILEEYQQAGLDDVNIAEKIYLLCENNKTITAQVFAQTLIDKRDEAFFQSIKNTNLKYLVEAIESVTEPLD